MRRRPPIAGLLVLSAFLLSAFHGAGAEEIDFVRDIRPIFAQNCYQCHGPDQRGGLRLDIREEAMRGGDSGPEAIVADDVGASLLLQRVRGEQEPRMPLDAEPLSDGEIERLERWIAQGAAWPDGVDEPRSRRPSHWAFVPPEQPELPRGERDDWPRNPIDHFVLARLEAEGLEPGPEADRYALIRRVSLDLTGLPPTPEQVERFVRDERPDAYERLVDDLLESPAYGERWAQVWLDVARYADTQGYEKDHPRTIWRYRDWVIDAFNDNMGFDRFTIEQIAGDLLEDPTLDQKIATAFHRNTMTNTEGGVDPEEFRVAAVKDRVATTAVAWMGLTMSCAECHTHKYDPITQREYYQFYAFFNQTADNNRANEEPTVPAPTRAQQEQLREIDAQLADLRAVMETPTEQLAEAQARWEQRLQAAPQWVVLQPAELASAAGASLEVADDGSVRVGGPRPERDTYTVTAEVDLERIAAVRLEALPDEELPEGGSGRADDGNFVLSGFSAELAPTQARDVTGRYVRLELPGEERILSLAEVEVISGGENRARGGEARQSSTAYGGEAGRAIDGNTDGRYDAGSTTHTRTEADPWWEVDLGADVPVERVRIWNRTDGDLYRRLAGLRIAVLDASREVVWTDELADPPERAGELAVSGPEPLALEQATASFSQDRFPVERALQQEEPDKSGWALSPHQGEAQWATFGPAEPVALEGPSRLTLRLEHRYEQPHFTLGRFRLAVTDEPVALERMAVPEQILAIVDRPEADRSEEQREKLAAHYRAIAPALEPVRERIAALEASRPTPPTVPVMRDLPEQERRTTSVMRAGNFMSEGEEVEPAVPAALHPLPENAPRNRLGVAKWLVDRQNPLTARVTVNRFWSHLFGTGIVETQEDFGTQGSPPTHPDLLDWLAVQFMEDGWDVKALLRRIVTSATYRQDSTVRPELREADPDNRLLARGPRVRLEAEMIRDQALAAAGLLSRRMRGPSVMPYQPEGVWQVVYSGHQWELSEGEDRHRRGLYTFWRRTSPHPAMTAFDAPSRELCTVRRIRTSTPLQALVTLNDPALVEAAQALARRVVEASSSSVEERATRAWQLAAVRPPHPHELERVVALYEEELAHYRANPEAAEKMATDPLGPLPEGMDAAELAAWSVVANVLLNLDEVLTKG